MMKIERNPIARTAQAVTDGAATVVTTRRRASTSDRVAAKSATHFTFTEANIKILRGPGPREKAKSIEYTDLVVQGLKIEVGRSGLGTFRFRYSYRDLKRCMRVGTVGAMPLAEARKLALAARADLDRGNDPQEVRDRIKAMPTFEEFGTGPYLEWARTAKKSHDDDLSRLRNHLIPRWGRLRMCDIGRREVDMMVADYRTKRSPGTVNRLIALTSAIYRQAMHWGIIDRNPCAGVKMLREPEGNENYMTEAEMARYLVALESEPNRRAAIALELLAMTGCRREEILQLRWENVSLTEGWIKLVNTKNGRNRKVTPPQCSLDRLKALKTQVGQGGSPWVFPGHRDPSKPISNVLKAMNRTLKVAGIGRHVRIHDLRHSVGAQMAQSGESLLVIGHALGHRSSRVTQRYAHMSDTVVADSLQARADRLASAKAANQPQQPVGATHDGGDREAA